MNNTPRRVTKEEWGKLRVAKINDWIITVTGDQHVLGALILFPPRKVEGSLADLTDIELMEFKKVAKVCEQALKSTFRSEWFNYSQAGNVVKSVHIHLVPRYSVPKVFNNYEFTDEGWGHPMKFREANELPDKDVVFAIAEELKKGFREIKTEDLNINIL